MKGIPPFSRCCPNFQPAWIVLFPHWHTKPLISHSSAKFPKRHVSRNLTRTPSFFKLLVPQCEEGILGYRGPSEIFIEIQGLRTMFENLFLGKSAIIFIVQRFKNRWPKWNDTKCAKTGCSIGLTAGSRYQGNDSFITSKEWAKNFKPVPFIDHLNICSLGERPAILSMI